MEPNDHIVNRVASSALVTFDLEEYYQPGERVLLDIKDRLHQGLILREKDFREFIKSHDWPQYQGKFVAISCSTDVVIPSWAFMLIAIALQPYAARIAFGTLERLEEQLFEESLGKVKWEMFAGAKVVVKGCSKYAVPVSAYAAVAHRLRSVASSIMFGEPCSTVPLFKSRGK